MEQGWDPEVKNYFKKILFSICFGLFWMMAFVTIGLYIGLAYPGDHSLIVVILFYLVMLSTLVMLLRYIYRSWKK
jgi:hypothetical protein